MRLYTREGKRPIIDKVLDTSAPSSQISAKARMMLENKKSTFGPFFHATMTKNDNLKSVIKHMQTEKKPSKSVREVKAPKLAQKQIEKVVINDSMLKYNDSFKNLCEKAEVNEPIVWPKEKETDPVFVDKLIIPHSWYYTRDLVDPYLGPKPPRKVQIGEGSSFADKVTMLGIVEATFGGQKGYMDKIVRDELKINKKTGLQAEMELLREHRTKWNQFNDTRWSQMY